MAIAGAGIIISVIGTMLVKIKSNEAKEAQVMGALNVGKLDFYCISSSILFCYYVTWMLPETMQMNFFGEGLQDNFFNACFLCYVSRIGCWWSDFFAVTEYYTGLGKKPILK